MTPGQDAKQTDACSRLLALPSKSFHPGNESWN